MTIPATHGLRTENWPRCFGCGTPAPKQSNNWSHGWVARRQWFQDTGEFRECYCPSCFREHGWPDWERIDREAGR